MLRKKLLTIACVTGILACGACFLPPIKTTPTYPPAPLRDELRGIKAIAIFVDDGSGSHFLAAGQVKGLLAANVDARQNQTHISCLFRATPRPKDAVLRITLLDESATLQAPASSQPVPLWLLQLTVDAKLTGPNGQILWQQQKVTYSHNESIQTNDPAEAWKDPKVSYWLSREFSDQLLGAMFYGN
jgi:hypothetical protein